MRYLQHQFDVGGRFIRCHIVTCYSGGMETYISLILEFSSTRFLTASTDDAGWYPVDTSLQ